MCHDDRCNARAAANLYRRRSDETLAELMELRNAHALALATIRSARRALTVDGDTAAAIRYLTGETA